MDYIYIGKFLGTHGLKGEIKLKTDFEYIDKVLKTDFVIFIGNDKKEEYISSFRPHKDFYLISLKGIDNIDLIHPYVNENIYIRRGDLNLSSNDYVMEDFLDKKVYYNDKYLGVISSITNYGSSNYVMEIVGDKELLVPYDNHFIDKVTECIYLKNLEGIINED